MFVCVCHAVSDTEVQEAIDAGARTREDVTRCCGAGGDCGGCHGHIEEMIDDHVEQTDPGLVKVDSIVRTRAA
jgi:bacterioferritin-associated ferredoxin